MTEVGGRFLNRLLCGEDETAEHGEVVHDFTLGDEPKAIAEVAPGEVGRKRVQLRLVRACHLLPTKGTTTSPFCKIVDRAHRGASAFRTRTIENSVHPVWEEHFELELDDELSFELALYSRGRWFFDDFLGSKRVVLPYAVSDLGGTIVEGEERLVTLLLDRVTQGVVEVGITPLNFDFGPSLRGVRRELPTVRCLWELHHDSARPAELPRPNPLPAASEEKALGDQPSRKGGETADGDARELLLELGQDDAPGRRPKRLAQPSAKKKTTTTTTTSVTSLLSSIAAVPLGIASYFTSSAQDKKTTEASHLSASSSASSSPSFGFHQPASSSSTSTSTSTSSSSSSHTSSYFQLLPPELIATIGQYVEHNTPYDPFAEWREDECARFQEATRQLQKRRAQKKGLKQAKRYKKTQMMKKNKNKNKRKQVNRDQINITTTTTLSSLGGHCILNMGPRDSKGKLKKREGGVEIDAQCTKVWREICLRVAPSGSMQRTRLHQSASFLALPHYPLSPKANRRAIDLAAAAAGPEPGGASERRADDVGPSPREGHVREMTFLCPRRMKRYTFKEKQSEGLSLRQYMLELDDTPMCNELLRNDKHTLCNLYSALHEEPHEWEFFLVRKYPAIHPYGYVCNKEDLRNFIFHSISRHKLGTVVERVREMTIGGQRALGCTFVTMATGSPRRHTNGTTFNCVTNFFVRVGDEACVFNFQYVTCWTRGNVTQALANHRDRESLTFYWMLRSLAFQK